MANLTVDFDGIRRVDVRNDVVDHVVYKDHLNVIKVSHTDEILFRGSRDQIVYTTTHSMSPSFYVDTVIADAPVGYWRLNETSGTTAADSSGNGLDGTYIGGVILGQPGLPPTLASTSVLFNGSNSYVSVPASAILNLTAAWTQEVWVYLPGTAGGVALAEDYPTNTRVLYTLICGSNSTSVGFHNGSWRQTSGPGLASNEWAHVVGTWDGTALKHFINGALSGTSVPGSLPTSGMNGLYIGKRWDNAFGPYFSGRIAEVAIYSTALSADKIAEHYAMGIGI